MSWKNRGTTARRLLNQNDVGSVSKRHCLLLFLNEGSHGIWPDHLIRPKGKFSFEAKYGEDWFECRVQKEGTLEECEIAQKALEKASTNCEKQWSSVDTELSDDENKDDSVSSKRNNSIIQSRQSSKRASSFVESSISSSDEEEILEEINQAINQKRKKITKTHEVHSKSFETDNEVLMDEYVEDIPKVLMNSNDNVSLSDINNAITKAVQSDLKKWKSICQRCIL